MNPNALEKYFLTKHVPFWNREHLWDNPIDSFPRCNIYKHDAGVTLEVALPGWKKEDLTIETEGEILKISGEQTDKPDVEYTHKGFSSKKFTKHFTIGTDIEPDSAAMADGVLTLNFRLKEHAVPKLLEIK